MECPCRYCNNRNAYCHGTCGNYKGWRTELDAFNEKERQKKSLDNDDSFLGRLHWRNVRRKC